MKGNTDQTILVVDDEKDIRLLLKECLEMEGYRVLTADCGAQAMALLGEAPDLILLDVNMPDLDGYLVCEKIRDYVKCPILFLTARTQQQDRVAGFKAGGDDYVTKPFGMEELLARIEAHLRREERAKRVEGGETAERKMAEQKMAEQKTSEWETDSAADLFKEMAPVYWEDDLEVDMAGRRLMCRGQDLGLTRTEFNIVNILLMNRGRTLNKEQIYEQVRGYDGSADPNIITEHIRRIRRKIQMYSKEEYIVTVWGVGYRWRN